MHAFLGLGLLNINSLKPTLILVAKIGYCKIVKSKVNFLFG